MNLAHDFYQKIQDLVKHHPLFPQVDVMLVLVNGVYCAKLSKLNDIPQGIIFGSIDKINKENKILLASYLAKNTKKDASEKGLFFYVPKNVVFKKPVYCLFISTKEGREQKVAQIKNFIVVDKKSELTIFFEQLGLSSEIYSNEVHNEIFVKAEASLDYYFLQNDSPSSEVTNHLKIHEENKSVVYVNEVISGSALAHDKMEVELNGLEAKIIVNSLGLSQDHQRYFGDLLVTHAKPQGICRILRKNIAKNYAINTFHGKIFIAPKATGSDAILQNRNLLLSNYAKIETLPELEIYNDDVKCSHGATVGDLDSKALFYLQMRGISEEEAKRMLLLAFAVELLMRFRCNVLREYLQKIIDLSMASS